MDGVLHIHPGKAGPWTFMIFRVMAGEGAYSAVADISFDGRHECKLVLSVPNTSPRTGDEMLKQKCIEWIEKAEADFPSRL